jgi:nucleoside-diphosphate-sugar epimerase
MKIFITGSSGYIGKELIDKISLEHEIVSFDLENEQDLLNYKQLKKAMKGCDIVIHLAAIRGPDETKSFENYFNQNCQATLNVAKACVENKIKRLIYSSSTGYYGVENGIPYVKPLKESNPIITQHIKVNDLDCRDCDINYSTSKVIAEQILANFGLTKKIDIIILRLGPIGGQKGEVWKVDGITLKIENAIQAIELAIKLNQKLWYEAFTITEEVSNSDISKAKNILKYKPI